MWFRFCSSIFFPQTLRLLSRFSYHPFTTVFLPLTISPSQSLLPFQIWRRIRCLSFYLRVLSTPVFLLTLCRFHIGEEGKKSSTPVLDLSKPLPISSPPLSCLLFACLLPGSALLWARGAPLTIPAKSYSCGCCQQATEDRVRATPRGAGGSPCGRHQGPPPVRRLSECALVSVYLFPRVSDSLMKNISTVDQFNVTRLSNACLPACIQTIWPPIESTVKRWTSTDWPSNRLVKMLKYCNRNWIISFCLKRKDQRQSPPRPGLD